VGFDIGVLSLDGEPKLEILGTPFQELHPSLSPDGRWLAYTSNESGQREVYVLPFPDVNDGKWQISTGGGGEPIWSRNGIEIFYRNADKMMAVPVSAEAVFTPGKPIELFEGRYAVDPFSNDMHNYDVTADGQAFVMIREFWGNELQSGIDTITLVQNWFEELKRLVPTN